MLDPVEFGKAMALLVKEAVAPLHVKLAEQEARIAEMEGREPEAPEFDLAPLVDAAVVRLLASDKLETVADLKANEAVAKHFAENPIRQAQDGAGIADLLIDREGNLVASFTDGRMKSLGAVVGKDGSDGKDGADFSGAELDYDGERGLILRANGNEVVKRLPIPMDKGYWREGMACEKADVLTHDGNAFIALRDTKAKPCAENKDDWRMLARKGRDGRDGKDGKPPPGPVKLSDA